jgi:hypothetical protein
MIILWWVTKNKVRLVSHFKKWSNYWMKPLPLILNDDKLVWKIESLKMCNISSVLMLSKYARNTDYAEKSRKANYARTLIKSSVWISYIYEAFTYRDMQTNGIHHWKIKFTSLLTIVWMQMLTNVPSILITVIVVRREELVPTLSGALSVAVAVATS